MNTIPPLHPTRSNNSHRSVIAIAVITALTLLSITAGVRTSASTILPQDALRGSTAKEAQTPEGTRARLRSLIPAAPGITAFQPAQHRIELFFEKILHELHVLSPWKLQYALQRSDERLAEFIYMQQVQSPSDHIDALTHALSAFRYQIEWATNDIEMITPSASRYRTVQGWYSRTISRDQAILQQMIPIAPEPLRPEIQKTIEFLRQKLSSEARRGLLMNPRSPQRQTTPSTINPETSETPSSPIPPASLTPEERKKILQERLNNLPPGALEKLPPEVRQRILDQLK